MPTSINKSTIGALFTLFSAVLLAGCGFSLAQDVTPPPNAQSFTAMDTPVASESIFPLVPPDPAQGGVIYLEKCAPCHGPTGLGDGPQAGQLPVPVPPLGDAALARQARPVDWYNMVTQGNLERYMPGFSSLDDRQRWDVVAYALTLSMDPDIIEQGQVVYKEKCQACHGESGQGSADAPSWLDDSTRLAQHSLAEMITIVSEGINAMPGFIGELSQAEIEAAAVYTRALSFASFTAQAGQPAPTSASTPVAAAATQPAVSQVTIQGKVTNVSAGELPEGLQAVLSRFEGMNPVSTQQTEVVDGFYRFEDVEVAPGQTFMVTIDYQGLTYSSDVYHTSESSQENVVDLPIDYYETTSDVSALKADRLHIFFDFSNPETVQVVELFILNNTGNRVVVPGESGTGVVEYRLPPGATNLQFEQGTLGERYIPTENGFYDTAAIGPGSGQQILFAYDVPYSRKMSLDIPIPMNVDAAVVMVPQGSVTLESDRLQSTGVRDVQGVSLELYTASALPAGSALEIKLSGRGSSGLSLQVGQTSGLLIGAAALGMALIVAGYWLLRQRKAESAAVEANDIPAEETAEDLMDAIIALDDRFKAGDLPEEAYLSRRNELKERLKARMK
jgi:mono/diheme cytochrome c family protein